MWNKSIYDCYMFYVYGEVSNWQLYDLKYELQCMQQSNFGKSLVSFCYTISQYPEIPGRSLCSVSQRARLSPVIKYRGHDCLHLLYLPIATCAHIITAYLLLTVTGAGHKTHVTTFLVLSDIFFTYLQNFYQISIVEQCLCQEHKDKQKGWQRWNKVLDLYKLLQFSMNEI